MREETFQLEILRQRIEAAENESGNMSDYLDRGRPTGKEAKSAQERMEQMTAQANTLKVELRDLIAGSPREAVEEWVNWHKSVLEDILKQPPTGPNGKTRQHVARTTLAEWEEVLQGRREHVNINWYFLKDYQEKAQKTFKGGKFGAVPAQNKSTKKSWWKFWE